MPCDCQVSHWSYRDEKRCLSLYFSCSFLNSTTADVSLEYHTFYDILLKISVLPDDLNHKTYWNDWHNSERGNQDEQQMVCTLGRSIIQVTSGVNPERQVMEGYNSWPKFRCHAVLCPVSQTPRGPSAAINHPSCCPGSYFRSARF